MCAKRTLLVSLSFVCLQLIDNHGSLAEAVENANARYFIFINIKLKKQVNESI